MQKLTYNGELVGEYHTRAECIVVCFENNLVYDSHSRKRNQLLPGVKIDGTDELGYLGSSALQGSLPRAIDLPLSIADVDETLRPKQIRRRPLPSRGPLDGRSR